MSAAPPVSRSYLYVPGHRPDLIARALEADADAVVVDLEDGVPAGEKATAREAVTEILARPTPRPVWVRVNPAGGPLARDDVRSAAQAHLAGLRLPKVESPEEVRRVAEWLTAAGRPVPIHCLIESAVGLERASELARAHPLVSGIALGEADLAADLGTDSDEGLLYARGRCVAAARAAGLAPPVQSVFTDLGDEDGLRRTSRAGRRLGFFGRSAIHPRQLAAINEAYTPSPEEVSAARELVAALDTSAAEGRSAFVLPDGRFVDPAVVEGARRTLRIADEIATRVLG